MIDRQSDGGVTKFPELISGSNRPVTWEFQLDSVVGDKTTTNSVTILSRPTSVYDESGQHGDEIFTAVTLTRAELAEILKVLEEDIEKMRKYCPDEFFA